MNLTVATHKLLSMANVMLFGGGVGASLKSSIKGIILKCPTIGTCFGLSDRLRRRPHIEALLTKLIEGHECIMSVDILCLTLECLDANKSTVGDLMYLVDLSARLTISFDLLHLGVSMNALYAFIAEHPTLSQSRTNYCWISESFVNNKLLLKRLLSPKHNEYPFWKSFICATICVLCSFGVAMDGSDSHWFDIATEPGFVLLALWRSMKYWNESQVQFVMRHNLLLLIQRAKPGFVAYLLTHRFMKITRKFQTESATAMYVDGRFVPKNTAK